MKKILIAVLVSVVMVVSAWAGSDKMGWNGPISGSLDGATAYHVFDLSSFKAVGFFSLQAVTTGAGTYTITYELSNVPNASASDYVVSGGTAIVTGASTGSAIYQWPVAGEKIFFKYIRLKFVATGAVVYTLYPNVQ